MSVAYAPHGLPLTFVRSFPPLCAYARPFAFTLLSKGTLASLAGVSAAMVSPRGGIKGGRIELIRTKEAVLELHLIEEV
ncbi:MAG: hypothetical protein JRN52_11555 [Nitrososphaerota archaeon]|nr:hypothetical protein [Nitrososphaerota archaeon]